MSSIAPRLTFSLEQLRRAFGGELVVAGDPGYDRARVVWNAVADRYPAIVARCGSVDDVVAALRFARQHDLVVAVRGGGHSVAGFSTCDGGMVIDLSGMRRVRVDPARRVARVEGGALLEELDRAAQEYGLACPVGVIGHTGVAGLTLGGGMGRLQRWHGYTVDNLLAVELVTADGEQRRVTADTDPELFWGLRGAGANFGIAVAFELQLHSVRPEVTSGAAIFPIERARDVAALYRQVTRDFADNVHLALNFATAPTGRAATPQLEGKATVAIGCVHFGTPDEIARDIRRLRTTIEPLYDTFGPTTYLAVQRQGDEEMAWGKRFYMKGAFLADLPDAAVDQAVEHALRSPGEASIGLWALGGATGRVAEDATAFSGRAAAHWVGAEALWTDREEDSAYITWGREAMSALKPFLVSGNYVNDVVERGDDVVRAIYGGAKYERLRALKRAHDPDNVFRLNQNIRP